MLRRLGFTGRLIAIVLLSFLILLAAMSLLSSALNWQRAETDGWAVLPERAAAVVELLDHADAAQRALILKAINSESVVAQLTDQRPFQETMGPRLPAVEWIIGQFLHSVGSREVIAMVERAQEHGWRDFKLGQLRWFAREPLRVAIALKGERWIVFETRVDISPSVLGIPPGFVIGIVGTLVGLAALVAIAREAKPLEDLSASVSRFAKDATPHPVRARGAAELAVLIDSVNTMQDRIAALLKGRTMLLGAISHDLKTFVTRLRLRVENIEDDVQRGKAIRDLDDVTTMIDDALTVAKGGAVSERRETVDLGALLKADIEDRPVHPDRMIGFKTDRDARAVRVACDPAAIRRVFDNVVGNAMRHASVVQAHVVRDGAFAVVAIDDNGPGIPVAERLAVFEPFYRLDVSRSRETGGSGLGLAIAKQIVDAHEGRIHISDSALGGARVVIQLPLPTNKMEIERQMRQAALF
jgi:two-component system, OmpR family, osmolarity sensor histidine kinase EnvZ